MEPDVHDPFEGAADRTKMLTNILSPDLPAGFWNDPFILGFIYMAAERYTTLEGLTKEIWIRARYTSWSLRVNRPGSPCARLPCAGAVIRTLCLE
jgi:hypothetical protein